MTDAMRDIRNNKNLRDQIDSLQKKLDLKNIALREILMIAESSVKTHGYDRHHVRVIDIAKRAI